MVVTTRNTEWTTTLGLGVRILIYTVHPGYSVIERVYSNRREQTNICVDPFPLGSPWVHLMDGHNKLLSGQRTISPSQWDGSTTDKSGRRGTYTPSLSRVFNRYRMSTYPGTQRGPFTRKKLLFSRKRLQSLGPQSPCSSFFGGVHSEPYHHLPR